ncbi:ParA family protein [Bradyrhizobium sp. LA2.1]|uniref:ParA family protein n=1 Tax=Bradyrhizobium sp. LA2.1 TaxID=3156376 RepID=UPI0033942E0C
MTGNKSPKTIATINFKGGVGKTTVTWCLADTLATYSNSSVLMFDLDAQMSLTQAVGLNEDSGSLHAAFGGWYDKSVADRRTIFDAIDQYTKPGAHFDFPIAYDFIYQIAKKLHFVPSVEDLYWLELEVFDRDQMKDFMRRLLGKIHHSSKVADYEYVLFDCPPSFTLLSYSVLSCCDLVLIPVNPDFFASRGVSLLLNSLKMRIEPHPTPQIAVFMNKTKTWANSPTKETAFYMRQIQQICDRATKDHGIRAAFFDDAWVRERVGIKRAITGGGVPTELVGDFQKLWSACLGVMK